MAPQTNGFPALLQDFFQRRLIAERTHSVTPSRALLAEVGGREVGEPG